MADFEKTVFEFPDEAQAKADEAQAKADEAQAKAVKPELEIDVIDDTPVADRGRTLMTKPPEDLTEEELEKYDVSAKTRIKHFTKGYHEERRAKEQAIREKDEALRVAQSIVEENRKLQGSLSQGQAALLDQAKKANAGELDTAKRNYREAYEAGDPDKLIAAQEAMTAAKIRADRIANYKVPAAPAAPAAPVVAPAAPQRQIDEKAENWQKENDWFGSDDEMTSLALGLHAKLVKEGVDPKSDVYYSRVNARMRQLFPEKFDSGDTVDAPTPRVGKPNIVAPATRGTAPRKVVLTQTQVSMAKRLGVPLELYARKVLEEMRK